MSGRDSRAAAGHILATERLILRPVTMHDHAALLALWTVPDVRRFLFDGAVLSAEDISEVIQDSVRDFAAVIGRLGMTPFETVPGLLGPMTRYRKTR